MNRQNITHARLQTIIAEEIKRSMHEAIDHASIREIVNGASKLLAAVESFKADASGVMLNAVTPTLSNLQKTLEDMVSNPSSYIDKQSSVKHVTLKPVKTDDKIV